MKTLLVVVLGLLLAVRVEANTCAGQFDGSLCQMADPNHTIGSCVRGGCTHTFSLPGSEPQTTSGVVSSSGSATVTGVGTLFTTEVNVGDVFNVGGNAGTVASITDDTTLILVETIGDYSSQTFTIQKYLEVFTNYTGAIVGVVNSNGEVAIGTGATNGRLTVAGKTIASCSGNCFSAPPNLSVAKGKGGSSSGGLAGRGARVFLFAGDAGDATTGSATPGEAGFSLISGGNGGNGDAVNASAGGPFMGSGGNGGSGTNGANGGTGGGGMLTGGNGGSSADATCGDGGPAYVSGGDPGCGGAAPGGVTLAPNGGRITGGTPSNNAFVGALQTFSWSTGATITGVCGTDETQATPFTVAGTIVTKHFLHGVVARITNGAGAARDFQLRLKRGGTGCADATDVDANGFAASSLGANGKTMLATSYDEAVPGVSATYRICVCADTGTGTQTIDYVRLTSTEY